MNRYWLPMIAPHFWLWRRGRPSCTSCLVPVRSHSPRRTRNFRLLFADCPSRRSYDANEKEGVLGPGWAAADLLSEIRFLDQSRFSVVQAGIPVFFQKVRNLVAL